jgi:hypothetical protein
MKKRFFVLTSIVVIVFIGVIAFVYFKVKTTPIGKLFKEEIPIAKSDVPVIYSLGWWSYQDCLKVESIRTEIVQSRLGLFSSHSLVSWTISGSVSYPKGYWKPFVQKVHLSEKYNKYDPHNRISEGDITITPIVGVIEDSTYRSEEVPFKIRIEEVLQSGSWGENKYVVHCGNITDTLKLFQYK